MKDIYEIEILNNFSMHNDPDMTNQELINKKRHSEIEHFNIDDDDHNTDYNQVIHREETHILETEN